MACIIGFETEENIKELERRGWEVEAVPESFTEGEAAQDALNENPRLCYVMIWVDTGVFDIMNGPDWEKEQHERPPDHSTEG